MTGEIPKIIPPRSRVRLVCADRATPAWQKRLGQRFRVGYYSPQDGLDCIWLVNDEGLYEQTTDREALLKYFEIERVANEPDYYGVNSRRLGRIGSAREGRRGVGGTRKAARTAQAQASSSMRRRRTRT